MSFSSQDYTFNDTLTSQGADSQYQVVQTLPTPTTLLVGKLFFLTGTPGALYVLRYNSQGTLVYTKLGGRAIRMKLASADFTPFGVGPDNGGLSIVPFDPSEPGQVSIAWTVVDITFRMETASISGATSLQIERSTGPGAFVNVGFINTVPVTIGIGAFEQTFAPATISQTIVNSGDKLRPNYTQIGTSASGFTVYVILRETN